MKGRVGPDRAAVRGVVRVAIACRYGNDRTRTFQSSEIAVPAQSRGRCGARRPAARDPEGSQSPSVVRTDQSKVLGRTATAIVLCNNLPFFTADSIRNTIRSHRSEIARACSSELRPRARVPLCRRVTGVGRGGGLRNRGRDSLGSRFSSSRLPRPATRPFRLRARVRAQAKSVEPRCTRASSGPDRPMNWKNALKTFKDSLSGEPKFSGSGRRLGNGDEPPAASAAPAARGEAPAASRRFHGGGRLGGAEGATGTAGADGDVSARVAPLPAERRSECSARRVATSPAVVVATPATVVASPAPSPAPSSGSSVPATLPPVEASELLPEDVEVALASCAVALSEAPQAQGSAALLSRVLGNVSTHPGEAKYRRVRLDAPRPRAAIAEVPQALELLELCGFQLEYQLPAEGMQASGDSAEADAGTEARAESAGVASAPPVLAAAVLPPGASLAAAREALSMLAMIAERREHEGAGRGGEAGRDAAEAGHGEEAGRDATKAGRGELASLAISPGVSGASTATAYASASSTSPPPPPAPAAAAASTAPRPRKTRVAAPSRPETSVPSWFFERTGREVLQALRSDAARREQERTLMTRAMRERLASGRRDPEAERRAEARARFALVRVRLPEGLLLEGEFNAREPVAAVRAWISDCLSDPLSTYDLIGPDRRPVGGPGARQTVAGAGLVPSAVLNLRWVGDSVREMSQRISLRVELLNAIGKGV